MNRRFQISFRETYGRQQTHGVVIQVTESGSGGAGPVSLPDTTYTYNITPNVDTPFGQMTQIDGSGSVDDGNGQPK
ncbi:MAG: hypothetical protein WA888_15515 [Burkholderiaceae bacterium]